MLCSQVNHIQILALIWWIMYVLFIVIVVFNMMLAIVLRAYVMLMPLWVAFLICSCSIYGNLITRVCPQLLLRQITSSLTTLGTRKSTTTTIMHGQLQIK